ncbi:MAG: FkbM family methyltransferase [Chlorobiales bacterium]|nr:FkbM family methyltransferase [Chlorobiales bacterium]
MNIDRTRLDLAWKEVEETIQVPPKTVDYQLEWGARREAFYEKVRYIPISQNEAARLSTLKNRFLNERIFIIGNGPSLNKTPLHLLQNEYTFITNRAYLLFDRLDWRPTFYTALDWRVVPDVAHEINLLNGIVCFFEKRFQGILRDDSDVYWYTHGPALDPADKVFAYNLDQGIRGAGSVIGTCIQIAFYLGFREIYLIGCDLGYKVLQSVQQSGEDKFGNGVKLRLTSTQDDDPNHFDPRYFGKNRRWHDPNVKRMISGHEQCLIGVEEAGGKIFNATIGGELEVYQRIDFESLFPCERSGPSPRQKINALLNDLKEIEMFPHSSECLVGDYLRCEHSHFDETDVICSLIGSNPGFMLDVGAHIGSSCLPFLEKRWQVHAFEPDGDNRRVLVSNVEKNGFQDQIVIDSRAVGDREMANVDYFNSDVSSGISGLSAFHESHKSNGTVDVVPLEKVLDQNTVQQVDFLKIDTEGFDLFVLKGFPWSRLRPGVIECEFEDSKTVPLGYNFHDLARFLLDKGYSVYVSEWYPIIRYGIRHDWRRLMRYPCKLADPESWGNLLAFRDPIDEKALVATLGKMAKPVTPTVQAVRGGMAVKMKWPGFRIEQSPCYVSAGSNQWRYTHSDAKQKFWIAAVSMPGRTVARGFVGGLRLLTDRAMTISVSLARYGNEDYEGTSKSVKLVPGVAQKVKLGKEFTHGHAAFKLQVEVLELEGGGSALLTVDGLYMSESPASIRRRVGETNLSLREANRLFRERDFSTAMGMYLLLYQRQPLKIYSDNALMAARKLDMDPVVTVEEML